MPAGRWDFSIEQNADFQRTLTWKDVAGNLVDLTGYSADMRIEEEDGTEIITISDGSGITLGGAAGTIALRITAAQTATFAVTEPNALKYDILMTDSGGIKTRLVYGRCGVSEGVTT